MEKLQAQNAGPGARNWWQTELVILIGKHTPKCREMVRILTNQHRKIHEPSSSSSLKSRDEN